MISADSARKRWENDSSRKLVFPLQLMYFLQGRLLFFQTLILLSLPILQIEAYELTVVNNATMGVNSTTEYLDNQLIWQSSSIFYLVQINDGSFGKVLKIDQSSGNNVTDRVDLPIDNFNSDLQFKSFNLHNTIGFMYNLDTESGSTSVMLTLSKDNLTEVTSTSLQNGYSDATYLTSYDGLLAISQNNQVNIIMNPEAFDGNTIAGPTLQNDWQSVPDASLIKSGSESFSLLFSPTQQKFQLIYLQTNPDGTPLPTLIPQSQTGVSAACFKGDSLLIIQQGSSINFYRLPSYELIDTQTTLFTGTSYCYYDDISDSIVFMKQTPTQTTFCNFQLSTGSDSNTTAVYNYSQFFPRDDNVYLVNKQNDSAVSYTIFDHQSCHHSYAYEPSNFECSQCPGGCISCNASQFCYDCFAGNFFIDDYCCGNSQYYTNISTKQCHNCPKGCYNCDNSSFCYLCNPNNFFIDDYCCGVSQFYVKQNLTKSCSNCPKGCYNCTNSSYCFTCLPKNNFIDDYCCGVSQYYYLTNATKNCGQCPSGCYNCSNSSFCYTCNSNYNYIDDYCCGLSSYYTIADSKKKCVACPTGCSTCSSSSNCLACKPNYSMAQSYCCSNTQYFIRSNGVKSCRNCPTGCSSCSNSISCAGCASGFTMGSNQLCYNSTQGVPSTFDPNSTLNTSSTIDEATSMVNNGFIGFFNSFPSVRGFMSPIFSAFLWFEEIYFFQFHERDYGKSMNKMFKEIQQIENQKWQGLNNLFTNPILSLFSTDIASMKRSLSYKSDYSSLYFKQRLSLGEGFLANTLSFLLSVVIFTIVFYLILRAIFFCLYHYRWSIFFRSYAFWPYLLILLFEGNLIQLIFFSCSDVKLSFSRSFSQKVMNFTSFLCLFIMVAFAGSVFLLLFSRYKKNTKYFTYNLYFKKIMLIYLTIQIGLRHLINAFLHYFLKEDHLYKVQFAILLVVQIAICTNYLYFILCDSFRYKSKVWLSLLLSFGKMVFIFFLYFRLEFLSIDVLEKKTDQALGFVVLLYIVLIYANVIANLLIFIRQFIRDFQKHIGKQSKDQLTFNRSNKVQPINIQQKDPKSLMKTKTLTTTPQLNIHSKQNPNNIFFQTGAIPHVITQTQPFESSKFRAVRIKRTQRVY